MTLVHYKKKDVVRSSVRGVAIEFDHLRLASILGIHGNNRICEYIKDAWEESKYTKPLEITRKFANDNTIMEARREVAPAESEEEEEAQNSDLDWEVVVDEAALLGESQMISFFNAQVDVEEPVAEAPAVSAFPASPGHSTNQEKEPEAIGIDPSCPSGHIPDPVMNKLQADFERARANRIQAYLEKAQAENARLLALFQQAQSQPKP
ncbi:hypothetical protein Dimus_015967 [Dionaea muscipula]